MKIALERAEFHTVVKEFVTPQIFEHTDLLEVLGEYFSENLGLPNANKNWVFTKDYLIEMGEEPTWTMLNVKNPYNNELASFETQHAATEYMSNKEIYAKVLKSLCPKDKHTTHNLYVEPTTTAHHNFVMKCADCNGAYVEWTNRETYEAYLSLQSDNSSDAK